ncbi:hypothetical protein M3Y97_00327200 [Aphelenchoides bicaudatus]|nr:hypothetical protein M3Y97_00327200 [Aphelenchoides bicaudatus]
MLATQSRNKRADKANKKEMSKNLEERVELLEKIAKYCEDILRCESKTDQNKDVGRQLRDLEEMWGRHGYLLSETTPGSDINTTKFFDVLFPSLQEGNSTIVELVIQNFELLLDISGDSLIPLRNSTQ